MAQLVNKYHARQTGSIAVGDSEGDIEMLEAVESPIAFNPSKKLFHHAQTHGWKVVIERKNMGSMNLNQKARGYVLSNAIVMKKPPSISIIPGFTEGPNSSKRLRPLLQEQGFILSSNPSANLLLSWHILEAVLCYPQKQLHNWLC